MIIAILALGLIVAGLTVVDRSPKAFVLARYYDLRNTLVPVPGMTAEIIPPEASVPETTPDALVDGTAKAWQMAWTAATQGSPCRVTPTTAVIQLSFARTRIREIDLRAGLLENNPNRLLQFRPQKIWIAYADQCQDRDLKNVERQHGPPRHRAAGRLDPNRGPDRLSTRPARRPAGGARIHRDHAAVPAAGQVTADRRRPLRGRVGTVWQNG